MTTSAPAITIDNTSTATFDVWITAVSTALRAVGLMRMGDTGQINLTSVSKPGANNTSAGYEIFQMSRFSDQFTRADGIITAGSQTSTGHAAAVYAASSGGGTMPYVVSNAIQAAAAPTTASMATALLDPGTRATSVDLDIITSSLDGSGVALWQALLRYTDDNNYITVQWAKNAGAWACAIYQVIAGAATAIGTSGSFGATDPTHLRAQIDVQGNVVARFLTGANQVYTAQTLTASLSINNNSLLVGTKAGFYIQSTSVADNLCIAEPVPVYLKLEYGTGSAASNPSMWLTVGASTDNAGTINSGLATTRRQLQATANSVSSITCYFSGDGSYVNMLTPVASGICLISIERTRTAAGVVTMEGLAIYAQHSGSTAASTSQTLSYLNQGLATSAGAYDNFAMPGAGWATAVVGADVYYFPRVACLPKFVYDLALMAAYTADVANLTTYSIPNCGSNHTYLAYTGLNPTPTASACLLVRYE